MLQNLFDKSVWKKIYTYIAEDLQILPSLIKVNICWAQHFLTTLLMKKEVFWQNVFFSFLNELYVFCLSIFNRFNYFLSKNNTPTFGPERWLLIIINKQG